MKFDPMKEKTIRGKENLKKLGNYLEIPTGNNRNRKKTIQSKEEK